MNNVNRAYLRARMTGQDTQDGPWTLAEANHYLEAAFAWIEKTEVELDRLKNLGRRLVFAPTNRLFWQAMDDLRAVLGVERPAWNHRKKGLR